MIRNFATILVYASLDNNGTNPMFDRNWVEAASRHRHNLIENTYGRLMRDLTGWEPRGDWPPPPPWALEECPSCHLEVERGTVIPTMTYHQDGDHWCKQLMPLCDYCQGDLLEIDEWPIRGDDGRFEAVEECAAAS